MSVACSSTVKFGDATSCWPSSRACPRFTSSFTDSRRQCGDPSKENGRMFAPGSPGADGLARRQLGSAPADCSKTAGVAVLLALYPGRTDVIDMPGTTPLPQTADCSVWVKILLRVFSCRNSLALVMDPNDAPPMGPFSRVAAQHWARHREDFPAAEKCLAAGNGMNWQERAGDGRRWVAILTRQPVLLLGSIRACTVCFVLHLPRCALTSSLPDRPRTQVVSGQWVALGWCLGPEDLRP